MRQHNSVRSRNKTSLAGFTKAIRKPKQLFKAFNTSREVFQKRRFDFIAERESPLFKLQRISFKPTKIVRQRSDRNKTSKKQRNRRHEQRSRPADFHDSKRRKHTEKHADHDLTTEFVIFGGEKGDYHASRFDIAAARDEPADRAASRQSAAAAED